VLMYIRRWLEAGVEQEDGSIVPRIKGTPQGGVISPLLANLYLHHAFDKWMEVNYSQNPFERYADDIIIHCHSKEEAEQLLVQLIKRMEEYELTLHPGKTKLVYCRNYRRTERHEHESFTFLSYSFQPRMLRDKFGRKVYLAFGGAISSRAKASIRKAIREVFNPRWTERTLEGFAKQLNPKIRGWINYYTRFYRQEALAVFHYLNELIRKWISNKYKLRSQQLVTAQYRTIQTAHRLLFYHWSQGIRA